MFGMIFPWWVRWVAIAALVLASCAATALGVADHYQGKIAKEHLEQQQAVTAELTRQAHEVANANTKIKAANEQHAVDQLYVNHLTDRINHELQPPHVPTYRPAACRDAETGKGDDREAGILSGKLDAALAKFKSGMDGLIQRCDQLNIDAEAVNRQIGD